MSERSRSREKQIRRQPAKLITPIDIVGGGLGYAAYMVHKNNQYYDHSFVGKQNTLNNGDAETIFLGDGKSLTFKNQTQSPVDIFPEAIKKVLNNQCPAQPFPNINIELSDAVSLTGDTKLYGEENLDKGGYGFTATVRNTDTGEITERFIRIAVGGFKSLQKVVGESYPEPREFGNKNVSPISDLNGTLRHEFSNNCNGINEELAYSIQASYLQTPETPFFIAPEGLKPNYISPEGLIPFALVIAARLLKRTFKNI